MQILFDHKDFLIIHKPAGIMVHGDGRTTEKTLADMITEEYPEIKEVGEPMVIRIGDTEHTIYRPGIVHRLDKDTSGVMVVAKNQPMFEYLKSQFKDRKISKTYYALVWGKFTEQDGVINQSIGRSPSDFRKWSAGKGKRGNPREAVTEYTVLRSFEQDGEWFSLVKVSPKTGRTHQIRVHMQHISHPLVCDSLYAPKRPCLIMDRLALHAQGLSFYGPDGMLHSFESPLPKEMQELLAK